MNEFDESRNYEKYRTIAVLNLEKKEAEPAELFLAKAAECYRKKDYEQAIKWCRSAIDACEIKRGEEVVKESRKPTGEDSVQEQKKSLEEYLEAARKGDAKAQYELAAAYEFGKGTAQSDSIALYWYKTAAENGYPPAQCALGSHYKMGLLVKKNTEWAVRWYRKAAQQGHVVSQLRLGECYQFGDGTIRDLDKAAYWYKQAAEQGDTEAAVRCKQLQRGLEEEKRETEEREKEIKDWYEQGEAYCYGKNGEKKDIKKAIECYVKAAEQDFAPAQYRLGMLYSNGEQMEKNDSLAKKWITEAAGNKNADAQYTLAKSYDLGWFTKKDVESAVKWYKKAAKNGKTDAAERAEYLEERVRLQKIING